MESRECPRRREAATSGKLGEKPPMLGPGERPAEPGREAGDGADGGQAGGATGRKMGSVSQTTGILAVLDLASGPACV